MQKYIKAQKMKILKPNWETNMGLNKQNQFISYKISSAINKYKLTWVKLGMEQPNIFR